MQELMKNGIEMTSRELAELTGKEHRNVMADIRNEIENLENDGEINELIFQLGEYKDLNNQSRPMFIFGKEGAMQIAMRYSAIIRRKVIIRLEELENKVTYKDDTLEQIEIIKDTMKKLIKKEISISCARLIISGCKYIIKINKEMPNKINNVEIKKEKIKNNITIKIGEFLLKHKEELVDKGKKSLQPAIIFKMMIEEIDGFEEEFKSPASFSQKFKKTGEFGFLTIRKSDGRSWSFTTVGIEETLNSND